jgi:hypothetical protein
MKDAVAVGAVKAVPVARELLNHADDKTRHWAVWTLFNLDARESAEEVYASMIENRSWKDINPYALAVAVKWKDARAFGPTMKWLTDKEIYHRSSMADQLVEVQATEIEDSLIEFLKTERITGKGSGTDSNIRTHAIRLLRRLKSRKGIPLLRSIVGHNDGHLSRVAAEQLGLMEAREATGELLGMLEGKEYSDWAAAALALARIGDPATAGNVVVKTRKRKAGSRHIEVLNALNKASAPDMYDSLRQITLSRFESCPVEHYLRLVAGEAGIHVQPGDDVSREDMGRIIVPHADDTAMFALANAVNVLNYSGYDYAMFLEEGKVHVLRVEQVYARWDEWVAAREASKQVNPQNVIR